MNHEICYVSKPCNFILEGPIALKISVAVQISVVMEGEDLLYVKL